MIKDTSGMTNAKKALAISDISSELIFEYLENPHESVIIVDVEGIIRFINETYEKVFSQKMEDVMGRSILNINPKSRFDEVLKTGKVIIYRGILLKEKETVVFLIPLKKAGKIIGAVGKVIFIPLPKLRELYTRITKLEEKLDTYKEHLQSVCKSRYNIDNIIGESLLLKNVKQLAEKAAKIDAPVLITGESGTGKELFAHAIHNLSSKGKNSFVKINCTTIPNDLMESELFGYSPGAFTGALDKGKIGKFELADKGTVFLDEIGSMPIQMQPKLLRVLQENEIERVGESIPIKVDFKLISATNINLREAINSGCFRLDLFHRINVIHIDIPPLRKIKEDIPLLAKHFLSQCINKEDLKKNITSISDEALNVIIEYSWPGNIRELKHTMEMAVFLCEGDVIKLDHFPHQIHKASLSDYSIHAKSSPLKNIVQKAEKEAIIRILKLTNNSRENTAKILDIHRTGLYKKMRKYGIP